MRIVAATHTLASISWALPSDGLLSSDILSRRLVASNQLSGSIPTEIGKLRMLQYMELGLNSISSAVPSELAQCPQLRRL